MTPPIIFAIRKKYIRIFRKANATSSERAISPKAHGIRTGLIFSKLIHEGTIRRVDGDRFYLDEAAARTATGKRSKIVLAILAVLFIALAIVFGLLN